MRYRKLGNSDLSVSEVSLGCWTLGGKTWAGKQAVGWADVKEVEAIQAIHLALEEGVNHFDNADVYGNGKAECMLAKGLGEKSKDVIIASKVGHDRGDAPHAYQAAHIRAQCERSLKNLNRDVIDLYYFHHGDFGPNDQYLDEAVAMMTELKGEGKIRFVGLSAYSNDDFTRLAPKIKPVAFQSWANAMDDRFIKKDSPVQKFMKTHNISFVAFSPLGQGLLVDRFHPENPPQFEDGDHRKGMKEFSKASLEALAPKLDQLKKKFGSSRKDLVRVALQFLLAHDTVGCVIPGFRNPEQVEMNVGAQDPPLTPEDAQFVRDLFSSSRFTHI